MLAGFCAVLTGLGVSLSPTKKGKTLRLIQKTFNTKNIYKTTDCYPLQNVFYDYGGNS